MSKAEELPLHSRLEPQDPVELVARSSHVAPRDPCLPPGLLWKGPTRPSLVKPKSCCPLGNSTKMDSRKLFYTCFTSWETEQAQYTDLCNQ